MRSDVVPCYARGFRLALVYCVLIAAFVLSLVAAYAIPNDLIVPNARAALRILSSEGLYPYPVLEHRAYMLDNFTDALMVDTAVRSSGDSLLVAGMAGRRSIDRTGAYWTITGLQRTLNGNRGVGMLYSHYWHGYQVFLRPVLAVLSYDQIRYLNVILLGALWMTVTLYLHSRTDSRVTVAFLTSLLAVGVFVVPFSLQFCSIFYLTGLAIVAFLYLEQQGLSREVGFETFFAVGMLTAFLDLLTAPILTLTMPLVLLILLEARKSEQPFVRPALIRGLALSASWLAGYLSSWATKWLLATLILNEDILGRAMMQLRLRSGTDGGPVAIRSALLRPIADLAPLVDVDTIPYVITIGVVLSVWLVLGGLAATAYLTTPRGDRARLLRQLQPVAPVLLIVPVPYLWFLVANNHTSIHHWFAYRAQAPSLFAVIYFAICAAVAWRSIRTSVDRQ